MLASSIEAIKIRTNKNLDPESVAYSDMMEVCDRCEKLDQANFLLKSKLLDLESSIPEEQRLESIIATKMEILALSDGKEYFEATNSSTGATWVLSISKKFGKTPHQLYLDAKTSLKKAETTIKNLNNENRNLISKLELKDNQIEALKYLKLDFSSDEAIVKTKGELEQLIAFVDARIKNFNNIMHRSEFAKLHDSIKKSYYESWERAAINNSRYQACLKEVHKLKAIIHNKKYPNPFSRIYKRTSNRNP